MVFKKWLLLGLIVQKCGWKAGINLAETAVIKRIELPPPLSERGGHNAEEELRHSLWSKRAFIIIPPLPHAQEGVYQIPLLAQEG
jgi:Na+/H+ antiporter NhaA